MPRADSTLIVQLAVDRGEHPERLVDEQISALEFVGNAKRGLLPGFCPPHAVIEVSHLTKEYRLSDMLKMQARTSKPTSASAKSNSRIAHPDQAQRPGKSKQWGTISHINKWEKS
jgi:hypothetical protein